MNQPSNYNYLNPPEPYEPTREERQGQLDDAFYEEAFGEDETGQVWGS